MVEICWILLPSLRLGPSATAEVHLKLISLQDLWSTTSSLAMMSYVTVRMYLDLWQDFGTTPPSRHEQHLTPHLLHKMYSPGYRSKIHPFDFLCHYGFWLPPLRDLKISTISGDSSSYQVMDINLFIYLFFKDKVHFWCFSKCERSCRPHWGLGLPILLQTGFSAYNQIVMWKVQHRMPKISLIYYVENMQSRF